MSRAAPEGEFTRGWPVLTAAAVGVGLGLSPLPFYTIGVFIPPLLKEFGPLGWTPGDVLQSLFVYTIGAFVMSPVIGVLAERFGARRVALVSIITFSFALMALAFNTGSKWLFTALWALLAVAGAGTLPITLTRPVANWFEHKRGLALGIALIATGVFGALAKFFAQAIVEWADWRTAYIALGALPLTIALPIAWLALRDLKDRPARDAQITRYKLPILAVSLCGAGALVFIVAQQILPLIPRNGWRLEYAVAFVFMALALAPPLLLLARPIGTAPPPARSERSGPQAGLSLREALGSWRFWLLAVCFVPISYAIGAVIPNIERVLTANAFAMDDAVGLATLTGLAVLGGRLIGGYLIDRFWAPGVAFVFLASPALALVLLGSSELSAGTATIAILMIGFGAGVEYDFMAYMVSRYFGMRAYSAIYGAIYGFFALGAGLGPRVMTDLADAQGWPATLTQAAVVLFVSTLPLLALGRYRSFAPSPQQAE